MRKRSKRESQIMGDLAEIILFSGELNLVPRKEGTECRNLKDFSFIPGFVDLSGLSRLSFCICKMEVILLSFDSSE